MRICHMLLCSVRLEYVIHHAQRLVLEQHFSVANFYGYRSCTCYNTAVLHRVETELFFFDACQQKSLRSTAEYTR